MYCVADLQQNLIDVYFDNGEIFDLVSVYVYCILANAVLDSRW